MSARLQDCNRETTGVTFLAGGFGSFPLVDVASPNPAVVKLIVARQVDWRFADREVTLWQGTVGKSSPSAVMYSYKGFCGLVFGIGLLLCGLGRRNSNGRRNGLRSSQGQRGRSELSTTFFFNALRHRLPIELKEIRCPV
jgi:hypothetical protein